MKKSIMVITVISMVVLLVGCGPSYDEEGFKVVENYAEEIIPAVDVAIYYLYEWDSNPTDDILEELYQLALKIEDINERYFADHKIPSYEKDGAMDEWHIMMGRGDRDDPSEEWEITGTELADAVYSVEADSWWFADLIIELYEAGGDLDARDEDSAFTLAEQLVWSSEYAEDSINDLRRIVFNR